jgi:hypothetical protein
MCSACTSAGGGSRQPGGAIHSVRPSPPTVRRETIAALSVHGSMNAKLK